MKSIHVILSLLATVCGCSTRPLPEDHARLDTYQVVQKIRCEIRDVVRGYIRGSLGDGFPEISGMLNSDGKDYDWLFTNGLSELPPNISAPILRYSTAAIGYNFTFDITEDNDFTTQLNLTDPITRGFFNIGMGSTYNRKRQNKREFSIVDNFRGMTTSPILDRECKKIPEGTAYSYPISGSLGMAENIGTFLNLNQSANLTGEEGFPTLSDTIIFTTEIKGEVNPSVELSVAGRNLQIADSNIFKASVGRKDIHQLILTITLPPMPGVKAGLLTAEKRAFDELERQRQLNNEANTQSLRDALLAR